MVSLELAVAKDFIPPILFIILLLSAIDFLLWLLGRF